MRSIAELLGTPPHSLWCFVLIMGGIEVFFSQARAAAVLESADVQQHLHPASWPPNLLRLVLPLLLLLLLLCTQIPSLEDIWWVSVMGTVASLGYVLAALILGLVYSGNGGGSIGGRSASTIGAHTLGWESRKHGCACGRRQLTSRPTLPPLVMCRKGHGHFFVAGQHPLCLWLLASAVRDPGHAPSGQSGTLLGDWRRPAGALLPTAFAPWSAARRLD